MEHTESLLVIGGNERFNEFLKKNGWSFIGLPMNAYHGSPSPKNFKAVVILHDGSSQEEMPLLGQNELAKCFSEASVGVVILEFIGYLVEKYKLSVLKQFFPMIRTSGITPSYEDSKHTIVAHNHPLLVETATPSTFHCLYSGSVVKLREGAQPLIEHKALGTALAVMKEPTRAAHFSGCPTYNGNRLFDNWETFLAPIFFAAVNWVAQLKSPIPDSSVVEKDIPNESLVADLRKALNNSEESDVTFILDDGKAYASRWLLGLRSDHFRALLRSGMKESKQEEIRLVDVRLEPFLGILEYLYTDMITFTSFQAETIVDIMLLADRFLLESLKILCENYLIRNLSVENVIHVLLAATKANTEAIKQRAISFVVTNKKQLQHTADFDLLQDDPSLLLEIVKLL